MHAIVIVLERAVALQQAEAARTVVDECGGGHVLGIDEWPREPLAGAGPEREPCGIVDHRAPVHAVSPAALGKHVPRRSRGTTETLDHPDTDNVCTHLPSPATPYEPADED